MDTSFEKSYAYAEVYYILNWLGEDYISKIPTKIFKIIREEKKYRYKPQIDFNKPLDTQVRQKTKNMIAYLNYNYWITDK